MKYSIEILWIHCALASYRIKLVSGCIDLILPSLQWWSKGDGQALLVGAPHVQAALGVRRARIALTWYVTIMRVSGHAFYTVIDRHESAILRCMSCKLQLPVFCLWILIRIAARQHFFARQWQLAACSLLGKEHLPLVNKDIWCCFCPSFEAIVAVGCSEDDYNP